MRSAKGFVLLPGTGVKMGSKFQKYWNVPLVYMVSGDSGSKYLKLGCPL